MREISVEGCELIGEGSSGKVYRIEKDMIAKVYDPGVSLERIENERINSKTALRQMRFLRSCFRLKAAREG